MAGGFRQLAEFAHAVEEPLPIPAGGAEDAGETFLQVVVGSEREQAGVVERRVHEAVVAPVSELCAASAVGRAHRRECLRLELPLGGIVDRGPVECVNPLAPVGEEAAEVARRAALGSLGAPLHLRFAALGAVPSGRAFATDETGKGLAEGSIVPHIDHAVRQFVEQQLGKVGGREVDEAGEQWVVEPTQGGIGGYRIQMHIVFHGQPRGFPFGRPFGEEAPVDDAADKRVAARHRRQRQLLGGHHVPHREAREFHIAAVARLHWQPQLRLGEAQHGCGQPQLRRQRGGGVRIRQHRLNVAPSQQQRCLAVGGLSVELHRRAAGKPGRKQGGATCRTPPAPIPRLPRRFSRRFSRRLSRRLSREGDAAQAQAP